MRKQMFALSKKLSLIDDIEMVRQEFQHFFI